MAQGVLDPQQFDVSRAKRGIWIWCVRPKHQTTKPPPNHHQTTTTMEEPWETVLWRSEGGPVTQWGGLGDSFLALGGEGP